MLKGHAGKIHFITSVMYKYCNGYFKFTVAKNIDLYKFYVKGQRYAAMVIQLHVFCLSKPVNVLV